MALSLILAAVLSFTVSPYEADSLDCESESTSLDNVASVRLYGAPRYYSGLPYQIRQRPTIPGPDTLIVEDSGGWSYWVTVVDQAGNESCRGQGITVGVTLGADYPSGSVEAGEEERFYDLSGRRLPHKPTQPGIYWLKPKGKAAKRILVFVKTP